MVADPVWNRVSVDLRGLQDRITTLKRYFETAGRTDVAENLEKAIRVLMEAQNAADELARRG